MLTTIQQVTIFLLVEGLKYRKNYQYVTQRLKVSKRCWKMVPTCLMQSCHKPSICEKRIICEAQ